MTVQTFLLAHGSALILPLAVVEGPLVSVLTGFLTAQGYFHTITALALLLAGDLIGDLIYYVIGRRGAASLAWLGARTRAGRVLTPELLDGLRHNAARMLLIGKWTHSVGFAVLIGCGAMRIPLRHFLLINLLAAIPKIGLLFALGYFAGDHYGFAERHALLASLGLAGLGVAAIALLLRRSGKNHLAGGAGR
jgi:membrane protein DedA with SNARE-associated domain